MSDFSYKVNEFGLNQILIVDDESAIRELLQEFLASQGYLVDTAGDGVEAMENLVRKEFDVIVTDLGMPNLDGFGLIKRALALQPYATIIVLSGQDTFENAIEAVRRGAYDFVAKPVRDFDSLKICIERGLERKSLLVQKENYRRNLEEMVREQTKELASKNVLLKDYASQLESVSVSVITSFLTALEEKDRYTAGHSHRVTHYSSQIAVKLNINGRDLQTLETAARLHDMGKLVIDVGYTNKPGPLNEREWALMKEHPTIADRFLAPLPFLQEVRPIVRHHHERLDGSGYPDGLRGDELDLLTQILAVADSYDAMTSRRSYREPMGRPEAVAELSRCTPKLFNPEVVEALIEFISQEPSEPAEPADDTV